MYYFVFTTSLTYSVHGLNVSWYVQTMKTKIIWNWQLQKYLDEFQDISLSSVCARTMSLGEQSLHPASKENWKIFLFRLFSGKNKSPFWFLFIIFAIQCLMHFFLHWVQALLSPHTQCVYGGPVSACKFSPRL